MANARGPKSRSESLFSKCFRAAHGSFRSSDTRFIGPTRLQSRPPLERHEGEARLTLVKALVLAYGRTYQPGSEPTAALVVYTHLKSQLNACCLSHSDTILDFGFRIDLIYRCHLNRKSLNGSDRRDFFGC